MLNHHCQKFKEGNINRAESIILRVEQLKTLVMVGVPALIVRIFCFKASFQFKPLLNLGSLIFDLTPFG